METDHLPALDVIVVTYNSAGVLPGLIQTMPAALKGTDWRVIVADNNSADDTLRIVDECMSRTCVIALGENKGYAAGINAALSVRRPAAHVLLLNPDVRLQPGTGLALLRAIERPGVGIVVPALVDQDGHRIWSLRRDPSISRAFGDALLGVRRAGRLRWLGETVVDQRSYANETNVDWATGCSMLISSRCIKTCGAWDESFFLYSEETEFCQRARRHGFDVRLDPHATAVHLEGESKVSPPLWALLVGNRVRLYSREHSRIRTLIFWSVAVLRESSRALMGRRTSRLALTTLLQLRPTRPALSEQIGGRLEADRQSKHP